ncbi:MAG: hypothetical protein H9W82_13375 [Lactobacillus sp.]|nr:hypothetical protein [Lactobacillus sp.]
MKTSEFKKAMQNLGFDYTENYFDLLIYKNGKEILRVNKQFVFFVNTTKSDFNNLSETQKQQVMKFVWAYICTPVEERGN